MHGDDWHTTCKSAIVNTACVVMMMYTTRRMLDITAHYLYDSSTRILQITMHEFILGQTIRLWQRYGIHLSHSYYYKYVAYYYI